MILSRTVRLAAVPAIVALAAPAALASTGPGAHDIYDARERTAYEQVVESELDRLHDEVRNDPAAWGHPEMPAAAPLTIADDISTSSRGWANELADTTPCDGSPICHNVQPWSEFAYHQEYCNEGAAENVVWRASSGSTPDAAELARALMEQWVDSDGHRRNLMSGDWDSLGLGVHIAPWNGSGWQAFGVANFRIDGQCTAPAPDPEPEPEPDPDQRVGDDALPAGVNRLQGADHVGTSVELARTLWADAPTVLLTTVSNYPDALAAASLAEAHDAPLLFTPGDRLDPRVTAAVRDLRADRVLVLGGPVAIADDVVRALVADTGVTATRAAAGDRFGTAAAVAMQATDPSIVFVVEGAHANPGRGWPDAVSVSSVAARTGHPVLLVTNGEVPDATRQALAELGTRRVVVVGGPVAVSDAVVAELDGMVDEVVRWAGGTRYGTSAEVVTRAGLGSTGVVVATGLDFRDALVAGPAAGHVGGLSVLVHGGDAGQSGEVIGLLEAHHRGADVLVVDTQDAMTDATVQTIARAVR